MLDAASSVNTVPQSSLSLILGAAVEESVVKDACILATCSGTVVCVSDDKSNEVENSEDEIFALGRAKGILHVADGAKEIYEEVNVRILFFLYF